MASYIGRLSGGPSFQPALSGFNIAEIGGNLDPASTAMGLGGVPQMQNGAYPEANPYLRFFGMPMRDGRIVNPPQNRDHFDWAEAYDRASVPTMTTYTITQLMESDLVLCRTVLPFQITEDKIDIKWNEWHFNDAMLDPRPAETASRLLSCNFTQGSDTMQTMGRAMEMEDGFYKTTAGQMHFIMQWKQIVNATAMTLEFGAATALANVRQPTNAQMEQLRSGISSEQLRAIVIRECRLFNCITTAGGLDIAIEHAERILASRGAPTADTVIVPDGTAKHINDPTFRPYYMTGVPVPEHPSTEVRYKNKRIISSRLHSVGGEGPPQDPHFRWVTTGTHYVSNHEITWDMDIEEYRTTMRMEQVWNETDDDYSFISLEHMLTNCGLFEVKDDGCWTLTSDIGRNFFAGCSTIGDYYEVQKKQLRLAPFHWSSEIVAQNAGAGYEALDAAGRAPLSGVASYVAKAAFLQRTHCPCDIVLMPLLHGDNPAFYYETSQELIDSILDLPIDEIGVWFQWCLASNVPIPISFILANPYQRWYAGLLQVMKAGNELGSTFIGHFDVQAGRDYVRKMLGLHVTAMMKSIVVNPKLIANAPNVLVKGYDGGGGVRPWNPNHYDDKLNFDRGNTQHNDQFIFAVNNLKPMWAIDLCGRFNPQIVTGPDNTDFRQALTSKCTELVEDYEKRRDRAMRRRKRFWDWRNKQKLGPDPDEEDAAAAKEEKKKKGASPDATDTSEKKKKKKKKPKERSSEDDTLESTETGGDAETSGGDDDDDDSGGDKEPEGTDETKLRNPYSRYPMRPKDGRAELLAYHNLMSKQHYTSAHIYARVWKFEHFVGATPTSVAATVKPKTNTLCMPGHQFSVSPTTTLVRVSKDHRGPYVYPGCGKVRTGLEIALSKPAYIGAGVAQAAGKLTIIQ